MGSFLAYRGTLEPYLSQVDVENLETASVIRIRTGLVGLQSGNVEKSSVLQTYFEGSSGGRSEKVHPDPAVWGGKK